MSISRQTRSLRRQKRIRLTEPARQSPSRFPIQRFRFVRKPASTFSRTRITRRHSTQAVLWPSQSTRISALICGAPLQSAQKTRTGTITTQQTAGTAAMYLTFARKSLLHILSIQHSRHTLTTRTARLSTALHEAAGQAACSGLTFSNSTVACMRAA